MFLFNSKKKKVVGTREKKNPYHDPNPQLGTKLGENDDKVVDEGYYEEHEEKIINDTMKTNKEKLEALKKMRDSLQKVQEETNEELELEQHSNHHSR